MVARAVQEHAARFFLKNGVPLLTTSVRPDEEGRVWAAAFDAPIVVAVQTACRRARFPLRAVVSSVDVLGHGLIAGDTGLAWPETAGGALVHWTSGRLAAVHRLPRASMPSALPQPTPVLATLGEAAWLFAAAYGAATSAAPLVWQPASDGSADAPVPRWRLIAAGIVAGLALGAAVTGPALAARVTEHRAVTHLRVLASAHHDALARRQTLDRVTSALREIAAIDADRRPVSVFLASLTHALPGGGAVLAIHLDSAAGSIVALAPHASAVLEALEHTSGVIGPEISGPVTRETVGGREIERVTIRFRRAP